MSKPHMSCAARQAASARLIQALARSRARPQIQNYTSQHQLASSINPTATSFQLYRNASSSSSRPQSPPKNKGPIVLEQPDKFRPPSHPARRNAKSTTNMYGGGAAYNQGMTAKEYEASKKKRYPNMFPEEGTKMHWFLTTRWVHVTLTLVSLVFSYEQYTKHKGGRGKPRGRAVCEERSSIWLATFHPLGSLGVAHIPREIFRKHFAQPVKLTISIRPC